MEITIVYKLYIKLIKNRMSKRMYGQMWSIKIMIFLIKETILY